MTPAEVMAADEIYAAGKRSAATAMADMDEARRDAYSQGALAMLDYQQAHGEVMRYAILYRIKGAKEYRQEGLTWPEFCESIGLNHRNVDRVLTDMRPIYDQLSDKMSDFLGVPLSKLRYLGRSISDNVSGIDEDAIVVGEERIRLIPENKDQIEALLDEIKASHKRERETLSDQLGAQKKITAAKQKRLDALEKQIAETERAAEKHGFESPTEAAYLRGLENWKITLDGLLVRVAPDNPAAMPPGASSRMKAAYLAALSYLKDVALAYHEHARLQWEPATLLDVTGTAPEDSGTPDSDKDAATNGNVLEWTPPNARKK